MSREYVLDTEILWGIKWLFTKQLTEYLIDNDRNYKVYTRIYIEYKLLGITIASHLLTK